MISPTIAVVDELLLKVKKPFVERVPDVNVNNLVKSIGPPIDTPFELFIVRFATVFSIKIDSGIV